MPNLNPEKVVTKPNNFLDKIDVSKEAVKNSLFNVNAKSFVPTVPIQPIFDSVLLQMQPVDGQQPKKKKTKKKKKKTEQAEDTNSAIENAS